MNSFDKYLAPQATVIEIRSRKMICTSPEQGLQIPPDTDYDYQDW